jgi:uncharacterized protein (DUF433 family)
VDCRPKAGQFGQPSVGKVDRRSVGVILPVNPLLQCISINPNVCFGKPCIRDTRIWVSLILDFLASGMTIEEVLAEYPQLTEEDVRAAIVYGVVR